MRGRVTPRSGTGAALAALVASGYGNGVARADDATDAPDTAQSPPARWELFDAFQGERTLPGRLTTFEPVYFIGGSERPEVKFQFSLKYRLLNFGDQPGPGAPHSLQLGFTQRSLWDVGGPSSPFYDTSYMPELFYQWLAASDTPPEKTTGVAWLGLQSGFRHESNGRAGADSRSLNVFYVRPLFSIGSPGNWHVVFAPQLYEYVGSLSDNPDISRYRGHIELRGTVGRGGGPSMTLTVIPGGHFSHGSRQLDLTLPVHVSLFDFSTFFLVQYFDGYGESLLSYNEHSSHIRAGIELVR